MYTVIDIGDFNGGGLTAINCHGQCVGHTNNVEDSSTAVDSLFYDGDGRVNLGHLGDELMTFAQDLNARGEIVGYTESYDKEKDAFLWQNGVMTTLPSLGGRHSGAYGINDVGQAVGFSYSGSVRDPYYSACLWHHGSVTELDGEVPADIPAGQYTGSIAFAVNDRGWVAGDLLLPTTTGGGKRACLWHDGQRIGLHHSDPSANSHANSINGSGKVVGWVGANETRARSCLWRDGGLQLLDGLEDIYSTARSINLHGQVVGYNYVKSAKVQSSKADYLTRAYLWEGGQMTDLNDVIDAGVGWTLTSAVGINDLGHIIGSGEFRGARREFLLVPRD